MAGTGNKKQVKAQTKGYKFLSQSLALPKNYTP